MPTEDAVDPYEGLVVPERHWPVDDDYWDLYVKKVQDGAAIAAESGCTLVGIARNAMPVLPNTLSLVSLLKPLFKRFRCYFYENDSEDGTDKVLDRMAELAPWVVVEHGKLGGLDSRGFEPERTERLAFCRNKCLDFVKGTPGHEWTIVLDLDPAGGFSVEGVLNSLAWLSERPQAAGMASYSLLVRKDGIAHYDAWAARPTCFWEDRRDKVGGLIWFSSFMPPVGSYPMAMNSAFGGMAVYRTEAFLKGGYSGGDCEHVAHHRRMSEAGYQMYLNPGSRYFAVHDVGD
jgi:hypothetical protein